MQVFTFKSKSLYETYKSYNMHRCVKVKTYYQFFLILQDFGVAGHSIFGKRVMHEVLHSSGTL